MQRSDFSSGESRPVEKHASTDDEGWSCEWELGWQHSDDVWPERQRVSSSSTNVEVRYEMISVGSGSRAR